VFEIHVIRVLFSVCPANVPVVSCQVLNPEEMRSSITYVTVIAAALIVSYILISRKRPDEEEVNDEELDKDNFNPIDEQNIVEDENQIEFILRQSFLSAASAASTLTQAGLDQDEKLLLYALYKQATVGDCNIDVVSETCLINAVFMDNMAYDFAFQQPSRLNFTAFTKYNAWNECKGMPSTVAMINYIDLVQHLISGSDDNYILNDIADVYYEDDQGDDDHPDDHVSSPFSGLGHKQSTFLHEEGRFADALLTLADDDDLPELLKRAMDALSMDDSLLLKACIDDGLNVNESDDAGQKLLHFAADLGSSSCIVTLLQCGADPNALDNDGISVLEAAVINGQEDAVEILLGAGADADHKDCDGDSARTWALKDGSERMKCFFNI
jgi:acyl-CoA-binding protein